MRKNIILRTAKTIRDNSWNSWKYRKIENYSLGIITDIAWRMCMNIESTEKVDSPRTKGRVSSSFHTSFDSILMSAGKSSNFLFHCLIYLFFPNKPYPKQFVNLIFCLLEVKIDMNLLTRTPERGVWHI